MNEKPKRVSTCCKAQAYWVYSEGQKVVRCTMCNRLTGTMVEGVDPGPDIQRGGRID